MGKPVLLVGYHRVVLDGLKLMINPQSDLNVIAIVSDSEIISNTVKLFSPNIIVKDITAPILSEIQNIESLKLIYQDAKILVLTEHEDINCLAQLRQAGISGYMLKNRTSKDLIHAIGVISAGGIYIDPTIAGKLIDNYAERYTKVNIKQKTELSGQEEQVLRSLVSGYSNKEIAAKLTTSTKTVETCKARIKEKLSLKDLVGLTQYALHQGWLTLL